MNPLFSGLHRNPMLLAVVAVALHVVTAWNSSGYHSADEHHQVIEFAQYKLGELPPGHLAWEYPTGIRSSIQPWIAAGTIVAARSVGIADPLHQAFLLRLFSALLALLAVRAFVRAARDQLPEDLQQPFTLLSIGLWFLPFLHVRFSSEGWSASFLLLGLAALLRKPDPAERWTWPAGAALTMAVLLRPSTAVVVAGAIAWLLVVRRPATRRIIQLAFAGLLTLLLGLVADSLFYGRVVLSTWNYWMMAVSGPPREAFDTLPWYYYPPWVVKYAIPPIGVLLLAAFIVLLVRSPRHLLVWCITPLLVMLTMVPHKEVRFLFPIADLAPMMVMLAASSLRTVLERVPALWRNLVFGALVAINLMALAVVVLRPAGNGRTALVPMMRDAGAVTYLIDPAIAWRIEVPPFYRDKVPGDTAIAPGAVQGPLRTPLVVLRDADLAPLEARTQQRFEPLVRTAPRWEERLMRWYTWNEGWPPWTLYRVHAPGAAPAAD
jgi:phosphatidylinositol glycan class B